MAVYSTEVIQDSNNNDIYQVIFVTMPGTRIQVQRTTSLSPANWVDAGTPIAADANGYATYTEPASTTVFFRAYRAP